MKLYFSPGACSLSPHIVARELGLNIDLIKVNLKTHQLSDGTDFYSINPKGQVPFLISDKGTNLSEGVVICQYLVDSAKNTTLLPAFGTEERYKVLEWQNYITTELHKSFGPLFSPLYDDATKALTTQNLVKKFTWVNSVLAQKTYLTGEQFTVADAYLYTVCTWAPMVKVDISHLEHLQAFIKRVEARPAVQEARKAESI